MRGGVPLLVHMDAAIPVHRDRTEKAPAPPGTDAFLFTLSLSTDQTTP